MLLHIRMQVSDGRVAKAQAWPSLPACMRCSTERYAQNMSMMVSAPMAARHSQGTRAQVRCAKQCRTGAWNARSLAGRIRAQNACLQAELWALAACSISRETAKCRSARASDDNGAACIAQQQNERSCAPYKRGARMLASHLVHPKSCRATEAERERREGRLHVHSQRAAASVCKPMYQDLQ